MAVLNKHKHGIPQGAVYIGRGSFWGNPFVIGKDGTRDEVCEKHAEYLRNMVRSAKAALTSWLKGKHEGEWDWDDSEWGGMYKYCIGYTIVPVPNRKREDMEVVEIVLQPQIPQED